VRAALSPAPVTGRVPALGVISLNNLAAMSSRLDKSWLVLDSHQTDEGNRCVDIFSRPDGTFGFEEFRRDPEDLGVWTPIGSWLPGWWP